MICRPAPWILALLFGLVALFPVSSLAAEAGKSGADSVGGKPGGWNLQLSLGYLPSADLRAAPGDVAMSDYRLKLARDIKLDQHLTLTLGGGYGLKHMDSSSAAALPQDLHSLYLEAGATYRTTEKTFASIKLYPGLYSDFQAIGNDDLRLPVLALGGHSFGNGISVIGGLVYRFGYHAGQLIPILGLSYQPNEYWRIDLLAPRPGISYQASRRWQLFLAGDFASDEYELKDRSYGGKAIRYSDYKVMGGVQYLPLPSVKISTSLGYAFERRFVFYDGNRSDLRMDDIPFLKLSLDLGW